jgi:hypothetical protein
MSAVRPVEQIAASAPAQTQLKQQRKWAPAIALFALLLAGIGVFQGMRIAQLETRGLRADGEVVDLKEESGSDGHSSYYPIVRYRTQAGADIQFKDSVGSDPPTRRPGDKVRVLYLEARPGSDAIIDRGAIFNWAIPAFLFAGAVFLGWLTLFLRRGSPPKPA